MAHGGEREGIELGTGELFFQIIFRKRAEHTAARGIDQNTDLRLLRVEHGSVLVNAVKLRQIETHGAQRGFAVLRQLLKALLPAGDDPNLVKLVLPVNGVHKFSSYSGGRAGDNGNLHSHTSKLCKLIRRFSRLLLQFFIV